MSRRLVGLGLGIPALFVSAFVACNSILGINPAQPEPADAAVRGDAGPQVDPYTLTCESYCNVMSVNCTQFALEDDTEYLLAPGTAAPTAVCKAICPLFESVPVEGGIVDPNEPTPMTNTLNCRVWHANAAQGGPPESHTHCPHAGPLGARMCGADPCQEFCTLDLSLCTGDAAAYASMDDCINACEPDAGPDGGYMGYPYDINPTDPETTDLASSGNTLNCRMYHLENFLHTGDPVHCSHTSLSGNGLCVN